MKIDIRDVVTAIDLQRDVVRLFPDEGSKEVALIVLNNLCSNITALYSRHPGHIKIDDYVYWLMGEEATAEYLKQIHELVHSSITYEKKV